MEKLKKVSFFTSEEQYNFLRDQAANQEMPMSRIISWVIDNAIENKSPFYYDLTLPDLDGTLEFSYAEECTIFMDFMTKLTTGMGLDQLMLFRHEMGIPDRKILLQVFAECLKNKLIEPFKPVQKLNRASFPKEYRYYRVKKCRGYSEKKNVKEYQKYLKLKEKYEKEA